ncbi:MAG: MarR family transcriptional regulator [Ruminiclostridium sp.]|nr:MarR family transcriptional regulator [Ruminiclostridium sp.]
MNNQEPRARVHDFIEFYHLYNSFVQYIIRELDDGIPKAYLGILLALDKYGPLPISHIGDKLCITKSNMTPLVDGMEEKGFISRKASSSDRRIINIVRTEKGERYVTDALAKLDEMLQSRNDSITREEGMKAVEATKILLDLGKRILDMSD